MSDEKEILCKELPVEINEVALIFPSVFGDLMRFQNISPDFFDYVKEILDKFTKMGVVIIEEDEKDPKRKSVKVNMAEVINNGKELHPIIKEIVDKIRKLMDEAQKRFELQTGIKQEKITKSGIVLPGSIPEQTPKIIV